MGASRIAVAYVALASCCGAVAAHERAVAAQEAPALAVDPQTAHREVVRALAEAADFLPVGFALDAMAGTAVAVHRRDDRHPAQIDEQDGAHVLLLTERWYFSSGRMIDLADAAIDSLAFLFEALFELHAQRRWLADPQRRAELEAIAAELYVDLPAELRLEALIDAQAQYAGHLLSIAASIERSARRREKACRLLETPLSRLWERTGAEIEYLGTVWLASEDGGDAGRWRTSEVDLPAAQRAGVRAESLAGWWVGNAQEDFGRRYCP